MNKTKDHTHLYTVSIFLMQKKHLLIGNMESDILGPSPSVKLVMHLLTLYTHHSNEF